MTVAQSVNKVIAIKKQSGLGVVATGASGSVLTRVSGAFNAARDTNKSSVINSHQQSTGVSYAGYKPTGKVDSELSTETFQLPIAAILRNDFAAVTPISAASITIAGAGPYTLTRAAGSYLTDGVKIGMVVRLTAGSFTAGNLNKNLLVTGVTATVLTVIVVNGSALTTEGPIASATVTMQGKFSSPPTSGHTNDYFTVEEWYPDISKAEQFIDARPSQIDISVPASGAATISIDWLALSRTKGTSQTLTAPVEPTFRKMEAVHAIVYANGSALAVATAFSATVSANAEQVGNVLGSNYAPDIARGIIDVSGSLTALFDSTTIQDLYANETDITILLLITQDNTAASPFIGLTFGKCKLTGDAPDTGKFVSRTYPFTSEFNDAGGAALANKNTIVSVQDSQL